MKAASLQCILDALSAFGENSKTAIMVQLDKEGISFTPDKFDITKFCGVVSRLLGPSADLIFLKISHDLCHRSGATLEALGLSGRAKYLDESQLLIEVCMKVETLLQNERRIES